MGGCRCTFRDCTNNTVNSPGKHFFHFPYKDDERCKKWALNTEKLSFLRLPWTQLRNKTVCEDHFTDQCFMNYKKERLVKTAVPTIYPTKDGQIHEIEVDNSSLESLVYCFNEKGSNQKTIDLPDAQQQQKRTIHVNLSVNESLQADDDYNNIVLTDSHVIPETLVDIKPITTTSTTNLLKDAKPVVLNRVCSKGGPKRFAVRNIQEKIKTTKRPEYEEPEITYTPPNKRIKSEGIVVIGRTYGKPNATNSITLQDTQDSDSISPAIDNGLNDPIPVNNHIDERDSSKVDKSLYMQMMAEHAKQIEDLKKLLTDKLAEKKDTQNSSASSSTDVRHIRVEKGPAMTKVQLFNGIRKYLNPTMVALLRMEMFGSSDREYRPDEKQLSKELYNLNQNVYDYMRDEWRFRLPPKADVEEWLKNPDDEETWELC